MAKKKKETSKKGGGRSPSKGRSGKASGGRKGARDPARKDSKPDLPATAETLDELDSLKAEMNRELARLRQRYMDSERERESLYHERMEVQDLRDTISNQLVSISQGRGEGVGPQGPISGESPSRGAAGGLQSAILDGPGSQPRATPAPPPGHPDAEGMPRTGPAPSTPGTGAPPPQPPAPAPQPPSPGAESEVSPPQQAQPASRPPRPPASPAGAEPSGPPVPSPDIQAVQAGPDRAPPSPPGSARGKAPGVPDQLPAPMDVAPSGETGMEGMEQGAASGGPGAADGGPGNEALPGDVEAGKPALPGDGLSMARELTSLREEMAVLRDEMGSMASRVREGVPGGRDVSADRPDLLAELGRAISQVRSAMDEMRTQMELYVTKGDLARLTKTLERVDLKIAFIEEEIGMGEALDVGKMPPHIIEIVYQATLDDIVKNMYKELGPYDTERHIGAILDDLHQQTSGSELFFFDGERLRTRNLSDFIQKKLISAKQVHMTYIRLQDRLKDTLPGYKPKNFRAMIRLKSQEFTIDRVLHLMEQFSTVGSQMDALRTSVLERVGSHEDITEQVHGRVEALVGRLGELGEVTERTQQKLGEMGEVIERLSMDKEGEGGSREASDALEGLKADLAGMDERMERTSEEISSVSSLMSSRLTRVEGQLEALAARMERDEASHGSAPAGGPEPPKASPFGGDGGGVETPVGEGEAGTHDGKGREGTHDGEGREGTHDGEGDEDAKDEGERGREEGARDSGAGEAAGGEVDEADEGRKGSGEDGEPPSDEGFPGVIVLGDEPAREEKGGGPAKDADDAGE